MKWAASLYEFVTGGSVAAPIGVAAAFFVAFAAESLPPGARATAFFATVLLGFVASTFERAR